MINVVLFVVFIFMSFMIMKSDINKLGCILFVYLSSISLENSKDLALIFSEILELIKLHTYKFGLVYVDSLNACINLIWTHTSFVRYCHIKEILWQCWSRTICHLTQ